MTDTKRKMNGSKSLAVEARKWLQRGVRPIPIKKRSKKPIGDAWNQQRVASDQIDKLFTPGINLGALWGKPSNWVVDIDLDTDEAVRAAASIFPRSYIYGTEVREESHYLYVCEGAKTHKWIDPETKETIVEIRSTGSQSVLPGSTHPDGHHYIVNSDRPFKKIGLKTLHQLCDRVAAISLLAKHYPTSGARHDYIHAVTGALLHAGAKGEEAHRVASAILDGAGRRETDRGQRERTIKNTIERHRDGTTNGWRTLSEYLPASVVDRCKRWLRFDSGEHITIVHSDRPGKGADVGRAEGPTKSPPKSLTPPSLVLPGLVGDIARWSGRRSMVKQPLFDLAVGLFCTALATGNRYRVGAGFDTPLQPYFMLLAPTSQGKENAHQATFELARRIGLGDNVFSGFQSYHVLADKVSGSPPIAGWLWDEAARHLKSASRPGSQDYQVLTWLMKLYGKASSSTPGLPARNEGSSIASIDFPFFLTLATAQPAPFIEAISSATSAFDTGLMNRFVLFDAGDAYAHRNYQRETMFPSAIRKACEAFKELPLPLEDRPQRIIPLDQGAFRSFVRFDEEAAQRSASGEPIDTLWGRANQNALILAGIIAVGIDHKKPRITNDGASWAIDFVRWTVETWRRRLGDNVSSNFVEAQSKTIEVLIRDCHKYAKRWDHQPTYHALLKNGKMPKACLRLASRKFKKRDSEETLEHLLEAEIIGEGETERGVTFYYHKGR